MVNLKSRYGVLACVCLVQALSACNKGMPVPEKTPAPPALDYFEKKRVCGEMIAKLEKKFDKDTLEAIQLAGPDGSSVSTFLDSVCFSIKYNTCVGFVAKTEYVGHAKQRHAVSETFTAINLLTSDELGSAYRDYQKGKGGKFASTNPNYFKQRSDVHSEVDCAP